MTGEMDKDVEPQLVVPAESRQISGSISPSNASFMDEKEKLESEPGEESFEQDPKGELEQSESKTNNSLHLQRTMSGDYPKAFRLISILIAVMLAVFLVSLDMVRTNSISSIASVDKYR